MPIVTIPALGQYGLVADQPAQELPINAVSSSNNVRYRDGIASRFDGHASIFSTPSVTPYWIGSFGTSTKRYWIHAGLAAVYSDDGTTRANITGTALTGAIDDRWTSGVLSGILIMNNGVDVPQYWAGTGTLAAVTGWDAAWTAKSVRTFKNYVVYLAPTKSGTAYPHTVGWSCAADPGALPATFDTSDATKDAGDVPLGETPDLLVDQLVLGEVNIIYKEASMYSMQYVGGDSVFAFKRLPGNFGMLARGCGAVTPKGHVVLANGDLVLVDGVSAPQSLLTSRYKRTLFSTQIDTSVYKRCFVVANPTKNEVLVCYPSFGSTTCNKALVWNWEDNTLASRDLPNVTYAAAGLLDYTVADTWLADPDNWIDDATLWGQNDYTPADARLMFASSAPAIYLADKGTKFGATAISWMIERTGLAFDDPDTVKTIKSLTPRAQAAAGTQFYVQLGGSLDAEKSPDWGEPILYTVGGMINGKAHGFATGKFLAYRLYGTQAQPVAFKSIDLDIEGRGKF